MLPTSIKSPSLFAAFVVVSSLSTAGCWVGVVRGNGDPSTERHALSGFDTIRTYGSLDVEVTMGDTESVEVTCDSNLHAHLDITVHGGELEFDTDTGVSIAPRTECVARVTATRLVAASSSGSGNLWVEGAAPELADLRTSGSGDAHVGEVGSESLEVCTTGSGNIELGGNVYRFEVKTTGSGDVRARDLVAQRVTARATGSGSIAVFAEEYVDARTTGSGDIDVWGLPDEHHEKSTGSGEVRFHW